VFSYTAGLSSHHAVKLSLQLISDHPTASDHATDSRRQQSIKGLGLVRLADQWQIEDAGDWRLRN